MTPERAKELMMAMMPVCHDGIIYSRIDELGFKLDSQGNIRCYAYLADRITSGKQNTIVKAKISGVSECLGEDEASTEL